jgi:hypothetical protein
MGTDFEPITERNTPLNGVTVMDNISNGRITWDASAGGGHGGYALTTDPTDAGLYFKFGSVAGIFSAADGSMFGPSVVAWSPVSVTGWYGAGWGEVPYSENVDIDAAYHTAANVKAGKGDPCRLVGLDLNHIATTDASALTPARIDNGIWRLPTHEENEDFAASPGEFKTLDGVYGIGFPGDDTFLPAAGFRGTAGDVLGHGGAGSYWSSTAFDGYYGYRLYFITTVDLSSLDYYTGGNSVRCVRQ